MQQIAQYQSDDSDCASTVPDSLSTLEDTQLVDIEEIEATQIVESEPEITSAQPMETQPVISPSTVAPINTEIDYLPPARVAASCRRFLSRRLRKVFAGGAWKCSKQQFSTAIFRECGDKAANFIEESSRVSLSTVTSSSTGILALGGAKEKQHGRSICS